MSSIIAQPAHKNDPGCVCTLRTLCRSARCGLVKIFCSKSAVVTWALLLFVADGAIAAEWGCYGTKPGHPTPEERIAFIREVGELAVKAEKAYGVPASVLAAIAIAESGYGWTRVALRTNNLFAWKFVPSAAAEGRRSFIAPCAQRKGVKHRYVVFASKADAIDFVASKLATLEAYREYTEVYQAARARGNAAEAAVGAWLSGIAGSYSESPAEFTKKITRIMNNPVEPADTISPSLSLHSLSARSGGKH